MNKEHYAHVCERFDLQQYSCLHDPEKWARHYEGRASSIKVRQAPGSEWEIVGTTDDEMTVILFIHIPSETLAEDVLACINETRILFQ